ALGPGTITPEMSTTPPTCARTREVLKVTVTSPVLSSDIALIAEDWFELVLGRVNIVGVPRPVAVRLSLAGVKAVTISTPPALKLPSGLTLPALATKTRELLGRAAACVGLTPMFASPMLLSPETSICRAVPGFESTLVLMLKTAWKFAGFGGVVLTGITTGR